MKGTEKTKKRNKTTLGDVIFYLGCLLALLLFIVCIVYKCQEISLSKQPIEYGYVEAKYYKENALYVDIVYEISYQNKQYAQKQSYKVNLDTFQSIEIGDRVEFDRTNMPVWKSVIAQTTPGM